MRTSGVFHLRNFESQWGEWPGDKVIIFRDVTLASSTGTVNLSGIVKEGAQVQWFMIKQTTVSSGTITTAAAVSGATDTVTIAIICRPEDLA